MPSWGAPGSGETYNRQNREGWNAERQSEEVIVAMIGVDNITRRSEGSISLLVGRLRPVPLRAATAKAYKKEGEKGAICICITMV